MKRIDKLLLKLLIVLPIFAVGQSLPNSIIRKSYDKLDNIKIDKIVYYQTPYAIYGNKPIETDYLPSWYWGYCATSYPLAFKDYVADANLFMLPPKSFSEKELKDYETKFKNLKIEDLTQPYVYCYGEIYLTDKKTQKQYIMLLNYTFEKEIPNMDFSNVDLHKFNVSKKSRYNTTEDESKDFFSQLYDSPITIEFYVLDNDGVYKKGNPVNIIQNVMENNDSNIEIEGNRFDYFLDMLKRAPNYICTYKANGVRIFETVKQTPKGIVVIGKKRTQLDEKE